MRFDCVLYLLRNYVYVLSDFLSILIHKAHSRDQEKRNFRCTKPLSSLPSSKAQRLKTTHLRKAVYAGSIRKWCLPAG